MQLIPCPWCGPRDEAEFQYGREAGVPYPSDPAALDDEAWARYLYVRANPRGELTERWYHQSGCRCWFTLTRDTVTYRFAAPAPVTAVVEQT